ncbi:MAG: hypothetical protein EOP11_13565 [Proteobacteria bacterium]|nr:MAG: hypothetical protein EOP11_13565 [Pseudomonadota bacterium]
MNKAYIQSSCKVYQSTAMGGAGSAHLAQKKDARSGGGGTSGQTGSGKSAFQEVLEKKLKSAS